MFVMSCCEVLVQRVAVLEAQVAALDARLLAAGAVPKGDLQSLASGVAEQMKLAADAVAVK